MIPLRTIGVLTCALALCIASQSDAQTIETGALQLETKIPLGDVRGRIDHMAIDLPRQLVFVAELENNSVGIVDLTNQKVIRTISGLKEPQGVAFVPSMSTLYVANAGDGSLRLFLGPDYAAVGQIDLGGNADNIRLDRTANPDNRRQTGRCRSAPAISRWRSTKMPGTFSRPSARLQSSVCSR